MDIGLHHGTVTVLNHTTYIILLANEDGDHLFIAGLARKLYSDNIDINVPANDADITAGLKEILKTFPEIRSLEDYEYQE